ncbi:hypothetical protein SBC1_08850 [Caballeronia sp. SBC1]|uniref:hypothetical protein n=1 Tax=Caballeronia sp. SBC1 TaxID=2705548 RepID=UPI00140A3D15|nr:hypothetical protein [Caballeronia sp. SBC1]QIN60906.1 hypothetical protein SBC1_08850 [Caballeronia sp. SBC1]
MSKEKHSTPVTSDAKTELDAVPSANLARASVRPSVNSAITRTHFVHESQSKVNFGDHHAEVAKQCADVVNGEMRHVEAMLMAQALSLDAIFNDYAQKATTRSTVPHVEAYMRMAMKAQAQCAMSLRVLGEIKSPKQVAFVKQQNVAHGHQQVNNGMPGPSAPAVHTQENPENAVVTNELLTDDTEAQHAATLDTGTTSSASRENQALETVGAIDRPEDA